MPIKFKRHFTTKEKMEKAEREIKEKIEKNKMENKDEYK